jgi:adhesin/invasin
VRAAVDGLAPVTFTATATAASASRLEFTVQPTNTMAGEAITPPIEVTARDVYGNRATGFAGTVTLSVVSGSLAGTTERVASGGVATFPGLSIALAGDGYRLSAIAPGVAGATSAAFDILAPAEPDPEPAAVAIVSGNGQGGSVGEALGDPYVVRVTDADGDPVPGVSVAWAVTAGGGSVSAGSSATNASGEASVTHTLGTGTGMHAVRATVGGLSPATFTATASAGVPVELVFSTQPSDATMGQVITPPVRVTLRDRYGNVATNFSGSITLSIAPLSGTPLASLNGTRTRAVSGGTATFDDLSIDLVGVLYRLRAAGAGLTGDSAPFAILLL